MKRFIAYTNKEKIGGLAPNGMSYVYDNNETGIGKVLLYPVENWGGVKFIGAACNFGNPPTQEFMNHLMFIGEFDSIEDIEKFRYKLRVSSISK